MPKCGASKTFAHQLAKAMGWTKILILTFKPAVQNAWEEDLANHVILQGGNLSLEIVYSLNKPILKNQMVSLVHFKGLFRQKCGWWD